MADIHSLIEGDPELEKAVRKLEELSADPKVRFLAMERDMARQLQRSFDAATREEGFEEGRAEGRRETLRGLLSAKFGEISEATQRRILAGSSGELQAWILAVLRAETLEAVFVLKD